MLLAGLAFLVVFLLIGSGGLVLFYREEVLQRLTSVISPRKAERGLKTTLQETGYQLISRAERVLPKSEAEIGVTQKRLIRAGFRKDSAIKFFYGAKVLLPLSLCVLVLVTGIARETSYFSYAVALAVGFLLPDFWLGRQITTRQNNIRRGLPDVLDLLVICIEAGLGIDQATARATEELQLAQPALSDELGIVVLEQRAGRPRSEAWKNFADRCDVEAIRNLVSVLAQSEQFGTSIAKTLRIHSDGLRVKRRQEVEEQAAKTTVKLVFPLVLFIFPSIFLVTLGPALIVMMEGFSKFFK
jgi:tight adherence protein C